MAVIKMQELKLNRLYQSEDNRSYDFALEKNDNLSDKDEKKKQIGRANGPLKICYHVLLAFP